MGRMSEAIIHKPLSHPTHVGMRHGSGTRMKTRKWVCFNPVTISSKVAGKVCRANNIKLGAPADYENVLVKLLDPLPSNFTGVKSELRSTFYRQFLDSTKV
jgi:hypothetical protein